MAGSVLTGWYRAGCIERRRLHTTVRFDRDSRVVRSRLAHRGTQPHRACRRNAPTSLTRSCTRKPDLSLPEGLYDLLLTEAVARSLEHVGAADVGELDRESAAARLADVGASSSRACSTSAMSTTTRALWPSSGSSTNCFAWSATRGRTGPAWSISSPRRLACFGRSIQGARRR